MPERPRITVIIPNLDQGLYLEQAICSVLDQDYDNLELIVMDGGSSDDSLNVISIYEPEIAHWQSLWDSGPAEAINTALTWATGDIVGVLHADDLYLHGALDAAAKAMRRADWAVGNAMRIDETDEELGLADTVTPRCLADYLIIGGGRQACSASFYRTDLLKAMGGFDAEMRLGWHHEMTCRLYAAAQAPAALSAVVACKREHDEAQSVRLAIRAGEEFIEASERYGDQLSVGQRYGLWRDSDARRTPVPPRHDAVRGRRVAPPGVAAVAPPTVATDRRDVPRAAAGHPGADPHRGRPGRTQGGVGSQPRRGRDTTVRVLHLGRSGPTCDASPNPHLSMQIHQAVAPAVPSRLLSYPCSSAFICG